jgi:hypothetical protein
MEILRVMSLYVSYPFELMRCLDVVVGWRKKLPPLEELQKWQRPYDSLHSNYTPDDPIYHFDYFINLMDWITTWHLSIGGMIRHLSCGASFIEHCCFYWDDMRRMDPTLPQICPLTEGDSTVAKVYVKYLNDHYSEEDQYTEPPGARLDGKS